MALLVVLLHGEIGEGNSQGGGGGEWGEMNEKVGGQISLFFSMDPPTHWNFRVTLQMKDLWESNINVQSLYF